MIACSNVTQETRVLYPMDSLLESQIKFLAARKATLVKSGVIDGKPDSTTYTPADSAWRTELEMFEMMKMMNKPAIRQRLLVDDGLFDPSSNLTVKAFSEIPAKTGEKPLPLKYVRVFYLESPLKPLRIEALTEEENTMYSNTRLVQLNFSPIGNDMILTGYTVEGKQKMMLSDSVVFKLQGRILLK